MSEVLPEDSEAPLPAARRWIAHRKVSDKPSSTIAHNCTVQGSGLTRAIVSEQACFVIHACDEDGELCSTGGDHFLVAIRCNRRGVRLNAKVNDNEDGTYEVSFKAQMPGKYAILVSLLGEPLEGSPFFCIVSQPVACAEKCALEGPSLTEAIARQPQHFKVSFRDVQGRATHAEELDVWVTKEDPVACSDSSQQGLDVAKDANAVHRPAEQTDVSESSAESDKLRDQLPHFPPADQVYVGNRPLVVRAELSTESKRLGQVMPGRQLKIVKSVRESSFVRACVMLDDARDDHAAIESWRALWLTKPYWKDETYSKLNQEKSSPSNSPSRASPTITQLMEMEMTGSPYVQQAEEKSIAFGWVTIEKDGKDLVTKHTTLPAHVRQAHMQHWMRRLAVDKSFTATRTNNEDRRAARSQQELLRETEAANRASSNSSDKRAKIISRLANPDARPANAQQSCFIRELESAGDGIGFAFGGMDPGRLKARGQIVEQHKVTYSVGVCGIFKLHVGLRRNGQPLPGSPFKLSVTPGPAHALATRIPISQLPLRGSVVSTSASDKPGCTLILQVSDKMGNLCTKGGENAHSGFQNRLSTLTPFPLSHMLLVISKALVWTGAKIVSGCKDAAVTATCSDLKDGHYRLEWRSMKSGVYLVSIMIDGLHIIGSPAAMRYGLSLNMLALVMSCGRVQLLNVLADHVCRLVSGVVDMMQTQLSGPGLDLVTVGKRPLVRIKCLDFCSNPSLPGPTMRFGMALLPSMEGDDSDEQAWLTVPSHEYELTVDGDELLLHYVAILAGEMQAHFWVQNALPTDVSEIAMVSEGSEHGAARITSAQAQRLALPGSPFPLYALAARANNSGSYIDGIACELEEKVDVETEDKGLKGAQSKVMGSGSRKSSAKQAVQVTRIIYESVDLDQEIPAGNTIMIQPQICDQFGNAAAVPDGALRVFIKLPDGTTDDLLVKPRMIKGLWNYDTRYELEICGQYVLHVLLSGSPIKGSPVKWNVRSHGPHASNCRVLPPSGYSPDRLLQANTPYTLHVIGIDKKGNGLKSGGAKVTCSICAVGNGSLPVGQESMLAVEDLNDGTYLVHISLIGSAEVKVLVSMDKDRPGYPGGGDLTPLPLTFTKLARASDTPNNSGKADKASATSKTPRNSTSIESSKMMLLQNEESMAADKSTVSGRSSAQSSRRSAPSSRKGGLSQRSSRGKGSSSAALAKPKVAKKRLTPEEPDMGQFSARESGLSSTPVEDIFKTTHSPETESAVENFAMALDDFFQHAEGVLVGTALSPIAELNDTEFDDVDPHPSTAHKDTLGQRDAIEIH